MSLTTYINYDELAEKIANASPSAVHSKNTVLFNYFYRYLLTDCMSVFRLENTPVSWDNDYIMMNLLINGRIIILDTDEFGVIPQIGNISYYNIYRRPAKATVVNPLFKKTYSDLQIGTQCALVKLQPDYNGLHETISYYADLLSLISTSTGVNLINSKLSYIFMADGKANAESFKKIYDKIQAGNPAIFADKKLFNTDGSKNWDFFTQNIGNNYIADKLQQLYNSVMNQFRTEIGIPNANFDKNERALTSEIDNNTAQTNARALLRLRTIQDGLDVANKLYNLDVHVRYNFEKIDGGIDNE